MNYENVWATEDSSNIEDDLNPSWPAPSIGHEEEGTGNLVQTAPESVNIVDDIDDFGDFEVEAPVAPAAVVPDYNLRTEVARLFAGLPIYTSDDDAIPEYIPISVDSVKDIWQRLTTVQIRKRFIYHGSHIEHEVLSILKSWSPEKPAEPSWQKPAMYTEPVAEESRGADLFGWDQPLTEQDMEVIKKEKRRSNPMVLRNSLEAMFSDEVKQIHSVEMQNDRDQADDRVQQAEEEVDISVDTKVIENSAEAEDDEFGEFEEGSAVASTLQIVEIASTKESAEPPRPQQTSNDFNMQNDPLGIYSDIKATPTFRTTAEIASPMPTHPSEDHLNVLRPHQTPMRSVSAIEVNLLDLDTPLSVTKVATTKNHIMTSPLAKIDNLLDFDLFSDAPTKGTQKQNDHPPEELKGQQAALTSHMSAQTPHTASATPVKTLSSREREALNDKATIDRIIGLLPDLNYLLESAP